jgi:hypothetical protein
MSDETKNPADPSPLGIDLSQLFRPAWTQESGESQSRLIEKFDEGDRSERGPRRGARGDRPDRGPRPERGFGDRSAGPRRGPSEGGARRGEGRGPRREGGERSGGDRGRGRDPRREPERRPEPAPKPALEGWTADLVPEPAAIDGIARQIRSRAKAYPLFELARLIVKLSDRYSVKLSPASPETPELHRVKLDGSVWQSRKEAVSHLLHRHRNRFYRSSSVSVEAPKGAFAVIAQCGMSGVLLGPPNHHEYTSKLIALHAARFRNLPFEVYKSRIKMVRDEALIEQWKTEQSTRTVFVPLSGDESAETPAAVSVETESAESTPVTDASPEPEVAAADAPETTETAPEATTPSEDPAPQAEAEGETAEVTEATEVTEDSPASDAPASEESPEGEAPSSASSDAGTGLAEEELTAHFLEHHAGEQIETTSGETTLPGKAALHGSTPLLRELLLKRLQELDRFPLPLAQSLGRDLTSLGLQIFKSHRKIIHVSVARPRYLDREVTPVGENFRAILEYLEAHPNQNRDKQWNALLRQRTETSSTPAPEITASAEAPAAAIPEEITPPTADVPTPEAETLPTVSETVAEAPVIGSKGAPLDAATAQPQAKARPQAPDEETLRKREQGLAADILWLLHQGHVIDFAMGNLQAATKPIPKPEPKKKSPAKTSTEQAPATPGEVQSSDAEGHSENAEGVPAHPSDTGVEIVIEDDIIVLRPSSTPSAE